MRLSVCKPEAWLLSGVLFLCSYTALASEQLPVPADEPGILNQGVPIAVSNDVSALAGTWGKCLKSVDTRCYYMSVKTAEPVSILTYISRRDKQFGEDPASKPHCYSATERKLVKLGNYTYAWQDHLAQNATIDPARLMKIVIVDNRLLVYSGGKLQLSLPTVSKHDSANIAIC